VDAIDHARAIADETFAVPRQLSEGPDVCRWNKAGPNQTMRQQVGEPFTIFDVGLSSWHRLDVLGIGEDDDEAAFEQVKHRFLNTPVDSIAIELSGTTSSSGSTVSEKAVHIFFTRRTLAKCGVDYCHTDRESTRGAWMVCDPWLHGAEIHSRGVWVHGSTDRERQFPKCLLAQMRIKARVDDRAEDVAAADNRWVRRT